MLYQIYAIAIKQLKILLRDPNGLVTLFALPLVFITVMTLAQSSAFDVITGDDPLQVLIVNQDEGELAKQAVQDLYQADNILPIEEVDGIPPSSEVADKLVADSEYSLAVIFPADFSQRVLEAVNHDEHETIPQATIQFIADPSASLQLTIASENTIKGYVQGTIAYAQIPKQVENELDDLIAQLPAKLEPFFNSEVEPTIQDAQNQIPQRVEKKSDEIIETLPIKLERELSELGIPLEGLPELLAPVLEGTIDDFSQEMEQDISEQIESVSDDLLVQLPSKVGPYFEAQIRDDFIAEVNAQLPSGFSNDSDTDGVRFNERPPVGFSVQKRPNSVQQNVPAWTIFGIFFIVLTMANGLLREKQSGVSRRLLAAPLSPLVLLIGSLIPYYLVNLLQVAFMFTVGVLLFGLDLGQSPLALLLVSMATSAVAIGLGLLVAAVSKSAEQVSGLSLLVITVFAAMGGIMVSRIFMPDLMQAATHFTPHAWALDGYHDVIVRGLGVNAVLNEVAVLLGFAVLFFSLALWRFRFD